MNSQSQVNKPMPYPHFCLRMFRSAVSLLCVFALAAAPAFAEGEIRIQSPRGPAGFGWLTRPYRPRTVPRIDLNNSPRIDMLIRGGNLYLSAQDVIALAIENNG